MKDATSGKKLADLTTVVFDLKDGNGTPIQMELVLQMIPPESEHNVIPWFIQDAIRFEEDKIVPGTLYKSDRVAELFKKGTLWTFAILIPTNREEGALKGSEYLDFAMKYYSDDDWNYLQDSFNKKFIGFKFDKPILVQRIQYLKYP